MATVNYIKEQKQSPSAMAGVIAYCSQELKTVDTDGHRYLSGVNCNGDTALQEFLLTKESWRKTGGTNFYQYVQSFSPEEGITHTQAHEIALEFASKAWPGHEILVATHCDADHPHSHFVINSVSFENGKKLRQNPKTLEQLRKLSDEICLAHGFSVLPPQQTAADGTKKMSAREYRAAAKGQSWKLELAVQINDVMSVAANKDEFLALMNGEGYGVTWTEDRKYITYQCPNGMKCRDNKLHEHKYSKEAMELEFRIRAEILRGITDAASPDTTKSRRRRSLLLRYGAELEGPAGPGAEAQRAASGTAETATGSDDGGENEQAPGLADGSAQQSDGADGGTDGAVSEDAEVGSEGLYERGPDGSLRLVETGWERERLLFLRAAERAQRDAALSQKALLDQSAAHGHYPGLVAGLDAVAAVAELFEGDSDDPEEQRRRMEARQAAENVGALLALAILLTERVLRRTDAQALEEEASLRQPEQEHSSQAEAPFQPETNSEETQDPDWLEAEEPQLVL
ncbi:MAG: relaxase/mobilization nuclease domain-containing protein [Oscillospiraceae bacterium]|nr:relaxase/mobilization nuclease domain-containing protein [Oscillospiraceae bacterium]